MANCKAVINLEKFSACSAVAHECFGAHGIKWQMETGKRQCILLMEMYDIM